jgi:glucan phosphoethanolaminetransferase (alkaline phosphatase superfamily)
MSSRKSSRHSVSRKLSKKEVEDLEKLAMDAEMEATGMAKKTPFRSRLIKFIFTAIYNCAILYYLYNLEDADCNCIRDWRHNFIKVMCLVNLFLGVIILSGINLIANKWITIALITLSLINFYSFFTYVDDLNSTQCVCAVDKQTNLNSIMNVLRWLQFIIFGLFIVAIVVIMLSGFAMNK